jgi:hypothetical protein
MKEGEPPIGRGIAQNFNSNRCARTSRRGGFVLARSQYEFWNFLVEFDQFPCTREQFRPIEQYFLIEFDPLDTKFHHLQFELAILFLTQLVLLAEFFLSEFVVVAEFVLIPQLFFLAQLVIILAQFVVTQFLLTQLPVEQQS